MTEKIAKLLERLAEMFPGSSYQNKLETYLRNKGATDIAQLESYMREFDQRKEQYL